MKSRLLIFGALVFGFLSLSAAEEPWLDPQGWVRKNGTGHDFSGLTNEEVQKKINGIVSDHKALHYEKREEFEGLLNEIAVRKSDDWESYLKDLLKKVREKRLHEEIKDHYWDVKDVEVLTTLRRLQGKPDPLRIGTKKLAEEEWEFPLLPVVEISASRFAGEEEDFFLPMGVITEPED